MMKKNWFLNLVLLSVFLGAGLAFYLYFGSVEDDFTTLCAIAAAQELDPATADDQKLMHVFQAFADEGPGRTSKETLAALAQAAPDQKYALLVSSAHHSGAEAYQCPALQRLLNPYPPGSAGRDWQLLCDIYVELQALPGLPAAEREQRILRRYKMEAGNEGIRAATALPAGERLAGLVAAVVAESGREPYECGLEAIWPGSDNQ